MDKTKKYSITIMNFVAVIKAEPLIWPSFHLIKVNKGLKISKLIQLSLWAIKNYRSLGTINRSF